MRIKALLRFVIAMLAGGVITTGCEDENYDPSDIGGTTEYQVNDLVLPINIDEIAMQKNVNFDDTGNIKVINGEYVLIDSGIYESDNIIVPEIKISAPTVAPITTTIKLLENNNIPYPLRFDVGKQMRGFSYREGNVSDYIVAIDRIFANFDITIDLSVEGLDNSIKSWTMEDLIIQLPKGLAGEPNMGMYDPSTGEVIIGRQKVEGMTGQFKMSVTEVDMAQAGAIFENHSFSLTDSLGIREGQIAVSESDVIDIQSLIQKQDANFKVQFAMGDININGFSGVVQYSIKGLDIADIPITGIPTILSQDSTDISLVNPQLYISFSNPLGVSYGLLAESGLQFTAKRYNGEPDKTCSVDVLKLACPGCKDCQFCLSPTAPGQYYGAYDRSQHIPFPELVEVLSGKGLPDVIGVSFVNPRIPAKYVNGFPIGANLGKITGRYTIYAPLQMKDDSEIIYESHQTGWWNECIENLLVKKLHIEALVTNSLPVGIEIKAYPIDRNGNRINDVEVEGYEIDADVVDVPLQINIIGEIKDFDGIDFVATVKASSEDLSLCSDEYIVIKNLSVKVSGDYFSE